MLRIALAWTVLLTAHLRTNRRRKGSHNEDSHGSWSPKNPFTPKQSRKYSDKNPFAKGVKDRQGESDKGRKEPPRKFGNDDAAMAAWADKHYPPDEVSPQQREALVGYKNMDYGPINRGLRQGDNLSPEHAAQVKAMDASMKPLPEDVIVVRGVGKNAFPGRGPSPYLEDSLPGLVVQDKGFTSTSLRTNQPKDFSEMPVVLRMKVPKGTPSRYLENIDDYEEQELLLGRGRSFVVTEVNDLPPNAYGVRRWEVVAEMFLDTRPPE